MITDLTLEAINAQFNRELQQQVDGTLPAGHVYRLGIPGSILKSIGMPHSMIELKAGKLQEKSDNPAHSYKISDVKGLPRAINNPLAVFAYGDKTKAVNLITEIEHNGKKFLVGISLTPTVKGRKLDINDIRNVFPKDTHEWVNWINQGKGLYYNKEKVLKFLDQQRINPAEVAFGFPEVNRVQQEKSKLSEFALNSAANVVKNFENPKLPEEEIIKKATLSAALKQALDSIDNAKLTETTKNQINNNNMKRTLTIALLLASAVSGAQTHFPKNFNVDLGGGVNDVGNYTPVGAVGYTFNNWFALYGRYSFATSEIEGGRLTYWEHTGEVYPSFTVLSYMDKWFVSAQIGVAYKYQSLLGIPTPSRDVTGHNFGAMAGVEGEWHFARFLSAFADASYRGLFFKEDPRYEPFASIGVRTSMRVFKKASRRR